MVRIKFVASLMAPDKIQRCPHLLRMYYEDDDLLPMWMRREKLLKEKEGEMTHCSSIPGSNEGVVYLIGEQ